MLSLRVFLVLGVSAAVVTGCANPPSSTPDTPEQVVSAYLHAIANHDPAAADRLLTPTERQTEAHQADSLLTNVRSMTDIHVGKAHIVTRSHVVYIPVSFVISQYRIGGWDNGPVGFGYTVVRPDSSHRWLIDGGGVA